MTHTTPPGFHGPRPRSSGRPARFAARERPARFATLKRPARFAASPRLPRFATPTRLARLTTLTLALTTACAPSSGGPASGEFQGDPLPIVIERPDFTLTDTGGRAYSLLEETRGRVLLLFFGYTWCPDVCPIHMANIGQVMKTIPAEDRHRVEVVFVSTDPARDSPERIREWLDVFDPSFVGLRGDLEEVNRIQNQVGLPASVADEPDEDGNYLVGHAAAVLAFSADGPARLRYPFGTRQSAWAHDLPRLIAQSGSAPQTRP